MKRVVRMGPLSLICSLILIITSLPLMAQLYTVGNGLKDIEGSEYGSVIIGQQEWMSENLNTGRYRNGQLIPNVQNGTDWGNLKTGAWAYYNNDETLGADYAKLYNWYAVDDIRGLCPTGWRVPDDEDWSELVEYLGGEIVAGGKLKLTGTDFWESPNTAATNESGFNGLPGGYRALSGGVFYTIKLSGIWWSATPNFDTENPPIDVYERYSSYLVADRDWGGVRFDSGLSGRGYSVRCIKDNTDTGSEFDLNNWRMPFNASIGTYSSLATIGVDPTVTDENELNIPSPPPPPGNYVRAVFKIADNGELGNEFSSDIRQSVDLEKYAVDWTVHVTSPVAGELNITVQRPIGLDLPISLSSGDIKYTNLEGNLSFNLNHDGQKVWSFNVTLGDTIPPEIIAHPMFEGPAIWDNTLKHTLFWTIIEDNLLESVVLEHSADNGDTWEALYTGTDDTYEWMIESTIPINELNKFRITATDGVGNISVYETSEPITTASRYQEIPYEAGWSMVGAPFITMDENLSTFNAPYRFRWGWLDYASDHRYMQGTGYWVGALEAGFDTVYGTIVDSTHTTWVSEGWRLMTVPLLRTVYVDSVIVGTHYSDEVVLYADLIDQEIITPPYYFDGEAYIEVDRFEPFKAYWIGTVIEYDSRQLQFPIHVYPKETSLKRMINEGSNYFAINIELSNQKQLLKIGTKGLSNRISPPSIPNGSRIGFKSTPTPLGNLYLSEIVELGDVTRQIDITNYAGLYVISWDAQEIQDMLGYLVLHDGRKVDLSVSGSIELNTKDDFPNVELSPLVTSAPPSDIPFTVELRQNYPNPFNPTTSIAYHLPETGQVSLTVHDLLGRVVAVLESGIVQAGSHTIHFDASHLSSGVYLYQLKTAEKTLTRKFLLLK
jgi:uncharacterized protein (TIGR02145 family)